MKNVEERIKARCKNRLRYAIRTKVICEDKKALLKKCLELLGEIETANKYKVRPSGTVWSTFNKNHWLYKHNEYVAGAGFDKEYGEFCYYLKADGTIIRKTNICWQRIH